MPRIITNNKNWIHPVKFLEQLTWMHIGDSRYEASCLFPDCINKLVMYVTINEDSVDVVYIHKMWNEWEGRFTIVCAGAVTYSEENLIPLVRKVVKDGHRFDRHPQD